MLMEILASNNYIITSKTLMKKIGLLPTILLGELCSEYNYWKKENELQDGYFYTTRKNIEENTTLSKFQQREAIKVLVDRDLLSTKENNRGFKRIVWYSIDEDKLLKLIRE